MPSLHVAAFWGSGEVRQFSLSLSGGNSRGGSGGDTRGASGEEREIDSDIVEEIMEEIEENLT